MLATPAIDLRPQSAAPARAEASPGRIRDAILRRVSGDDLRREIETLLDGRSRHFRPSPALDRLCGEYSWPGQRRTATDWLIGSCLIDALLIPFDALFDARMLSTSLLWRGGIASLAVGLALRAWRHADRPHLRGLSIMVVLSTIMVLAGVLGGQLGGDSQQPYVFSALFGTATALIIIPLHAGWTAACAVAICLLYGFFQAVNPVVAPETALVTTVYFAMVCTALVLCRRAMNRVGRRGVLMIFRDQYRVRDLADANRTLERLATTDVLTGLKSRRHLMETFTRTTRDAAGLVSIVMLDIDHFKRLNDTMGHAEGDRCLALVGAAIADGVRDNDACAARYGGEEFVVLLPHTGPAAAAVIGERLRARVEALRFPHPDLGPEQVVTVSVGVATRLWDGAETGDGRADLMKRADLALYEAKRAGRNRVAAL